MSVNGLIEIECETYIYIDWLIVIDLSTMPNHLDNAAWLTALI